MRSAMCVLLPLLQYFTGWCVMVDVVVTALLVSLCCVVYLLRIPSLCLCTYRYVNNGLISVSHSTDLDSTRFFSM